MINKNIVKQPKSVVEVQVAAAWDSVQPTWDATLQKIAQETELSGFRKGTAPLNLVEQQMAGKLQEEALKTVMPQLLIEALKGSDIVPIDYPKYQLVSFAKGQGIQFKATVTNRPAVAVGNYKTIKAQKPAVKSVSEEEVTKVVDDLFKRFQARAGAQPAAVQPAQNTQTGQGGSISFNQPQGQIATSPTAPRNDGLTTIPNDDFAKAMGAKDLNDLKTQIRKDLEDQVSYNNELDYEEAILQEVEKLTNVEIPEVLVQDELNRMLVSLQRRVADMGLLMEDYLKGQGKTLEAIKKEWTPQAEKNVRMELGLAEVARMENVNITDVELQAEIDKIQDAKIKQQFEYQEPRLQLRHSLRQVRTLELLKKIVTPS